MSKRIEILSQQNIDFHNNPPKFNAEQRKSYFYISNDITNLISSIRGKANKVFFVVAYVYLKKTAQFYSKAYQRDIDYVCKALKFDIPQLNWDDYKKDTQRVHQYKLSSHLGLIHLSLVENTEIKKEINRKLHEAKSPRRIFYDVVDILREKRMVIPVYSEIADLISNTYEDNNKKLINIVKENLTQLGKDKLENLLEKDESPSIGKTKYKLTHTKRFSHSTKLNKIRKNIEIYKDLFDVYSEIRTTFQKLNLSEDSVKSFASAVQYRDVFRFKRTDCYNRYLHLIVYVSNQLYRLQDILIRTFISIQKSAFSLADKNAKNEYFKNQRIHSEAIEQLYEEREKLTITLKKATHTLENQNLSFEKRVEQALKVLKRESKQQVEKDQKINELKENAQTMSAEYLFLKHLELQSLSIEKKCKPILLLLTVDFGECEAKIGNLIEKFQHDEGKIENVFSVNIVPKKYQAFINSESKLKPTLHYALFCKRSMK